MYGDPVYHQFQGHDKDGQVEDSDVDDAIGIDIHMQSQEKAFEQLWDILGEHCTTAVHPGHAETCKDTGPENYPAIIGGHHQYETKDHSEYYRF